MNPTIKIIFSFKYKEPQINSLKALSSKVTPLKRNTFQDANGNILELLTEKVDMGAITTLAQYYDIPLHSFTFSDFQLAPTLKEFERILDRTIKDHNPFPKLEEDVTMAKVASVLCLDVNEVIANWASKGAFKGFTRKFLEDHAWKFIKVENEMHFMLS